MAVRITEKLYPSKRSDWRTWLSKHHDTTQETWVVLYKKSSGKQTVTFADVLDEALCFGWIDSMEKGVDAETYAVRFTPRKAGSTWSAMNKKRYKELLAQGAVTQAGKRAYAD